MNTSRKLLIAGAAALASMAVASTAAAQASADGTGTASVKIITKIQIAPLADLRFGTVVPTAAAGTVTIGTTDDTASTDGNATVLGSSTTGRAKFEVTGEKGQTYTLTLPTSDLVFDNTNAPGLKVTSWTSDLATTTGAGLIDASTGKQDFFVGGTLDVPANAPANSYSGTFTVTVAYN